MFYLGAAVYVLGTIIYLVFGSGEVQPWAMPKKEEELEGLDNTEKETLPKENEKEKEKDMA